MPDDEKHGQDIHNQGYLFPFAGKQLDEYITQHAKCNAFGNAVCQGHDDDGKKHRQRFGIILQVDFLDGADHK